MNEQEKEINLKRLCYKALKNWRKAALVAIIGALVLGGTKMGVEMAKISDPEVVEKRQRMYEGELAKYQQEGDEILKAIDDLEASLVRQTEYNEESVIMKVDPYEDWRGSIDFYVETDWQILPELSVQAQNPANQIVRVYSTYITNGELYQYVLDRMGSDMEIRYLQEMMSASADANNYLIHFSVRGVSQAECQQLLTYIEEGMKAKQAEILSSVGEFKLLTTNSSTYSQINYDLEQTQKNNVKAIEDMNTALSAKQFELIEWEEKEEDIEVPVVNTSDAVKAGIKMAILTGIVLGVVVLLYYGVRYITSKFIQDREEFDGWGVFVAELPKKCEKRAFRWIDRIVGNWFLGNVYASEYEVRLTAAAKHICEAAKLSFETEEPKLVLVSDMKKEELDAFAEALQRSKAVAGVRLTVAGNPLLTAEAIDDVLSADGVVLVAKQEESKRESVYQIKAQVEKLQKQMVAVVLLEADAIV